MRYTERYTAHVEVHLPHDVTAYMRGNVLVITSGSSTSRTEAATGLAEAVQRIIAEAARA